MDNANKGQKQGTLKCFKKLQQATQENSKGKLT